MKLKNSKYQNIDWCLEALAVLPKPAVVVDSSLCMLWINQAARKKLKFSKALTGKDIFSNFAKLTHKGELVSLQARPETKAFKTSKPVSIDTEADMALQLSSGKYVPVCLQAVPFAKHQGKFTRVLLLFEDVSVAKRLDADRINFISLTAHQLRSPLIPMRWFMKMLLAGEAGKLNPTQRDFAENVTHIIDHMLLSVNILLQIARVESGRVHIKPTTVDIQAVLQKIIKDQQPLFAHRQLAIRLVQPAGTIPKINLDEEVFWQVMQNLLANAAQYSFEKKTIFVKIKPTFRYIEISVTNQGIGIPKPEQSHIFEKFYRAQNARSFFPEGTGLGLGLAKTLVEGWGGKIWFESEESKQTSFFITIPLQGMKPSSGRPNLAS